MENASKALLMAASVLIGVLLLSLGGYLFNIFGGFASDINAKITEKEISKFNAQFTKYESYQDDSGNWKNLSRAQDIVSIANLAKENNQKYDVNKGDAYYVQVIIENEYDNFETNTEEEYKTFLRNFSGKKVEDKFTIIYYICKDVRINPYTKKVDSITFKKL